MYDFNGSIFASKLKALIDERRLLVAEQILEGRCNQDDYRWHGGRYYSLGEVLEMFNQVYKEIHDEEGKR